MGAVTVCLEINSEHLIEEKEVYNQLYDQVYKPLLSFMYAHPKFPVAFSFSGPQFESMAESHGEVMQVFRELTGRHQAELLGGGFHSPVFPLLFPVDKSGQIEKYTALLRSSIGKRPVGMALFGSVWDSSLVPTLHSCGIQYIHLDSSLIPTARKSFFPIIVSEQGKSVKVIPLYTDLQPSEGEDFASWSARIQKAVKKEGTGPYDDITESEPVAVISFSPEEFKNFHSSQCFKELISFLESEEQESGTLHFSVPQEYLKGARRFTPAYISAGMDWRIAQWSKKPFCKSENKSHFPLTIYDFLNTYPLNRRLYERMMHISMLISQLHGGDKIRKLAASEKLWEAQAGSNYVNLPLGLPAIAQKRQKAYQALNEAERLLRECKEFKENLTSFDYNGDGLNEYVCQMEQYDAVISPRGAQITEFNELKTGTNNAANLSRMEQFDGKSDLYQRGLFVEHLLDEDQMKSYLEGNPIESGIFSRVQFTEKRFDARRREISLEGKGEYSSLALPVSLRKNFTIHSNGISVQYILKNEGPFPLKGTFVTELNLAQTHFKAEEQEKGLYSTDLIVNSQRCMVSTEKLYKAMSSVSLVQLTDTDGKTAFVLEPNEEAGFEQQTLEFKRPTAMDKIERTSRTLTAALFWNVELDAGREMEKTLNLTLTTVKNRAGKKK